MATELYKIHYGDDDYNTRVVVNYDSSFDTDGICDSVRVATMIRDRKTHDDTVNSVYLTKAEAVRMAQALVMLATASQEAKELRHGR